MLTSPNKSKIYLLKLCKLVSVFSLVLLNSCSIQPSEMPVKTNAEQLILESAKQEFYEQKYKSAIGRLLSLIGKFDGEPEYFIALSYLNDENDPATQSLAVKYLRSSVEAGYSMAMWELGRAYETGIGVDEDYLIALDWYRKYKHSTNINLKSSRFFVTMDGDLIERSYQELFQSLLQHAKSGDKEAQIKVAGIYDDGTHVKRNEYKAFYWYLKAAELGSNYAQLMLGYFYCRAIGVSEDIAQSNYWFKQSQHNILCHE